MKKTLLITLEYPPMIGGVANYYQNLVEQLPSESIHVLDNATHALLSTNPYIWPKWLKGLITITRKVQAEQINHILVGQILPLGTVAIFLYFVRGIPYTVMTHAMDVTVPFGPKGSRFKQLLMRFILRHAEHVTAVSSYTKMQLESLLDVNPKKIHMIYPCPHINGIHYSQENLQEMRAKTLAEHGLEDKRILLSVSRLIERKGIDYTIAALPLVRERIPEVEYIVIGEGRYLEQLKRLAKDYGVDDIVRFLGKQPDQDVAEWFATAEIFLMPSRELKNRDVEGFGIVFVEAGSFGKPVIGGKSGGILDAVIDGYNGYLVNAEDIEMIAAAMIRLLTNPGIAEEMGAKGRTRVEEFFRWEIQAKKLETLLQ